MATVPTPDPAFDLTVAAAAARRWAGRGEQQAEFEQARQDDNFYALDTPKRRQARAARLMAKLQEEHPEAMPALARRVSQGETESAAVESMVEGADAAGLSEADTLERMIGATRDFLGIEFLARGMLAARSVVRVAVGPGGRGGFGTGFLISPRLLLTNNHVLGSAAQAADARVEFDFQRDVSGRGLPVVPLSLVPDQFFLTDKALDYALVAVSPDARLAGYGWLPLLPSGGKIVKGEPVCLIQHPKGEMKQVVLWENRLMDVLTNFLHYEADTEPGSSGSPVFNTQWEVVALHHSGVPATDSTNPKQLLDLDGQPWNTGDDPARLKWVANEGVRVSVLLAHLAGRLAALPAPQQALLKEALDAAPPPFPGPVPPPPRKPNDESLVLPPAPTGSVSLTVPLTVTLSLGGPDGFTARLGTAAELAAAGTGPPVTIDPDFSKRKGYNRGFLGFDLPFPRVTAGLKAKAYKVPGQTGDEEFLLKYHHYSLIFHKERKLAVCAGVNYDPTAKHTVKRGEDKWFFDPRVKPQTIQCGEPLYENNPFDRGHLVRRVDAGWGHTPEEALRANNDTFHFTNCSPQHAVYNQGKTGQAPPELKLWGSLEEHVAAQGKQGKRKLSIFNGPVFAAADKPYPPATSGKPAICRIPEAFWKLVAWADDAGQPAAAAFVLTQKALIEDLLEEFKLGQYKAVQVAVSELAGLTKLDFGPLVGWDVIDTPRGQESTGGTAARVLESVDDVVL